jgi:hypothetical protein
MDGGQINTKPELEEALAKFRARREPVLKAREEAVKKFVDEMPGTYFSADYRQKWSTASVTVENLDGTLATFFKRVTTRIMTLVGGATEELMEGMIVMRERIKALEKAAEEQKANPPTLADAYRGVWQPGLHDRGAVVTMGGSLWLCFRATTTKPGSGGDDWKLIVKRGRNAQEAP